MQTEYASRPHPRITTTIFSKGQVLHKIEKVIEKAVESIEDMHEAEDIINVQHREISKIIREKGLPSKPAEKAQKPATKIRSDEIRNLDEVKKVYIITPDGKISGDKETTREFKKMFKHILKELPEMLNVFTSLPGAERREEGLYEVEPGRILIASTGVEYYLILLQPGTEYNTIYPRIKNILNI